MTRNGIEHQRRVGVFIAVTAMVCALVAAQMSARAAGPPATVDAIHGTPQSTAVNSIYQVRLVAYVRDAGTNGVPGLVVTFTAPASGPSASFSGSSTATVVTDGSGVASAPDLLANGVPGSFTLTATVAGLSATYNLDEETLDGVLDGGPG